MNKTKQQVTNPRYKLVSDIRSLQHSCSTLTDRCETIRKLLEQESENLNDNEACDIYDGIDNCITELSMLKTTDLQVARFLLKERVESFVNQGVRHIKQKNITKMQGNIPEELKTSKYLDQDGKERYLKVKRQTRNIKSITTR
jgi:hypothetical protein